MSAAALGRDQFSAPVYVPSPGLWYADDPDVDGGVEISCASHLEPIVYCYRAADAPLVEAAPLLLVAIDDLIAATTGNPDDFNRAFSAAKAASAIAKRGSP